MLALFIDAEDRSPLSFVCLITVLLPASQSLQLAIRRGWNALFFFPHIFLGLPMHFDCSHFYILKQLAIAELAPDFSHAFWTTLFPVFVVL